MVHVAHPHHATPTCGVDDDPPPLSLVITRRNGHKYTVLYDASDHDLVSQYKWNVLEQTHTFYARCCPAGGRHFTMHRLLMPDTVEVDHINHNGLDNRRANLRPATRLENIRNRRAASANGYKGVFPDGNGRWRARIMLDGTRTNLGSHDTPADAARAYDIAAFAAWGKFAYLNFPP